MTLIPRLNRARIALAHDTVMAAISFPLALYLRLGEDFWPMADTDLATATGGFTIIAIAVFLFCKMYRGIWRYASVNDLLTITKAVTLAILVFLPLLFVLTRLEGLPRSAPLIQWFLLMALLGGPRFCYRLIKDRHVGHLLENTPHRRVSVLLIGAGDAAETFIREQARDRNAAYRVTGVIDHKGGRVGRDIHSVPVLAGLDGLDAVLEKQARNGVQRLVLTAEDIDGSVIRETMEIAERHGLTMARLPRLTELKAGIEDLAQTRPIDLADLLGRPQAVLDRDAIKALVTGKRVLVTGAGGTIGSELVRQISDLEPAHIALFDNAEYHLYQIDLELGERHPEMPREAILGSVRDPARIEDVITRLKPALVFHAAALKHVPMVEANPMEGVLTNTIGSQIVANACRKGDVDVMVQISTDKAVNPTNVMGATKRLAESYCQSLDVAERSGGGTRYVTVRFGNVLGSTGSVVPLFQRQLARGGPLTVTHKDITRYFMTTGEAVELVLQASAMGVGDAEAGGKIFVLDMGAPVKIIDLAEQMIRLSGQKPGDDIKIEITGLRPGEKLHEELLHESEDLIPAQSPGLFLAAPEIHDLATLEAEIEQIAELARARNRKETLQQLARLVPEYQPASRK
ncbi:MAG: nucleotide sugar dehydratase [Rhodospirillaceae bacterium]|nr:nucleotide sugar dehydratase [Rhodospirillaceae bacterium]HAA93483.1 nucleotide sugar dehydratase [Rhodospirillaceae bacterium]